MSFLQICTFIGIAYLVIALIVFLIDLLTEYLLQKQNEIIQEHARPTIMSIVRTIPSYLIKDLLWWREIKELFD